jgi:hypothetical protein
MIERLSRSLALLDLVDGNRKRHSFEGCECKACDYEFHSIARYYYSSRKLTKPWPKNTNAGNSTTSYPLVLVRGRQTELQRHAFDVPGGRASDFERKDLEYYWRDAGRLNEAPSLEWRC